VVVSGSYQNGENNRNTSTDLDQSLTPLEALGFYAYLICTKVQVCGPCATHFRGCAVTVGPIQRITRPRILRRLTIVYSSVATMYSRQRVATETTHVYNTTGAGTRDTVLGRANLSLPITKGIFGTCCLSFGGAGLWLRTVELSNGGKLERKLM
jgi:hypothetical protein